MGDNNGVCGSLVAMLFSLWQWVFKRLVHVITRSCELERIIDRPQVTPQMVARLSCCIQHSAGLTKRGLKAIVFGEGPFNVEEIAKTCAGCHGEDGVPIKTEFPIFRGRSFSISTSN